VATTSLDFVVKNGLQVTGNVAVCGISTFSGNIIAGASTNLGPVGNVIITGGYSSNVLTTDGSGNLSWGNATTLVSAATPTTLGTLYGMPCSTTATANTGVGYQALNSVTTGTNNTAIGWQALRSNTSGSNNTALGISAMYSNTIGNCNTALGICAMYCNTIGCYNTAVGTNAMILNTTGGCNTAVGVSAMYSNTTGRNNTAVGVSAMSTNTTGINNTAVGVNAMYNNTTGSYNTALGISAMYSNTTGCNNTAIGCCALWNNTTGSFNTAIGSCSGISISTGSYNLILGSNSGAGIATTNCNVLISDGSGNVAVLFNGCGSLSFGANAGVYGTAGQVLYTQGTVGAPYWGALPVAAAFNGGTITCGLTISNATVSTSTTTGALVVNSGGAGIVGNLNVGGSVTCFSGAVGIATSVAPIANLHVASGQVIFGATATSTNALKYDPTVSNGFIGIYDTGNARYYGISRQLPAPAGASTLGGYFAGLGIGGSSNNGNSPIFGVLTCTQSGAGQGSVAFTVYDTNKVVTFCNILDSGAGAATICGVLTACSTTSSTSQTSGSIVSYGGVGVVGNVYVGNSAVVQGTTSAISTTSGALVVSGGAGIAGNVYVGGITNLGPVGNVIITGGSANYVLTTNGSGQLSWQSTATVVSVFNGGTIANALVISNTIVSTSTTPGALVVNSGGAGLVGNVYVGNSVVIQGTTQATTSTTGALVVSGGIGVAKDLVLGGNLTVNGTLTYINSNTTVINDPSIAIGTGPNGAALTSNDSQDRGIEYHYYNSGDKTGFFGWQNSTGVFEFLTAATNTNGVYTGTAGSGVFGAMTVSGGTQTTSASTGALVISGTGGAGIGGNLYVGGITTHSGNVIVNAVTNLGPIGNVVITGGTNNQVLTWTTGNVLTWTTVSSLVPTFQGGTISNALVIANSIVSTSTTTGALVVNSGGAGIVGNVYVGNSVVIQGTALSTSTTTGALVVTNGVGIGGNLYVGGNVVIANNIIPSADNTWNLGSASNRWANMYTGDLQLSNEGSSGNDIDGTTGSWTIQEGLEDLYLINQKTGKRYAFVLKEV